jgi:hypothetical protein
VLAEVPVGRVQGRHTGHGEGAQADDFDVVVNHVDVCPPTEFREDSVEVGVCDAGNLVVRLE